MDWSLKVFLETGGWGDNPPTEQEVETYNWNIEFKDFAYHSIVNVHDDRISNINKLKVLRKYSPSDFSTYLEECFTPPFAVKNPHFAILYPLLIKHWPESKLLVVFRNPDDTISSAKQVTPSANYALYEDYYSRLLNRRDISPIYFSYDALMDRPIESVKALADALDLSDASLKEAAALVQTDTIANRSSNTEDWPANVDSIYNAMKNRAINCE